MEKVNFYCLAVFILLFTSCVKEPITPDEPEPVVVNEIFDLVGQVQLPDGPHDIKVFGDYAYACRNDVIYVVDLSDTTSPILIDELNDLTVTNTFESLVIGNNNVLYAGCTSTGSIYMFNISNPASPQLLGKFSADIYPGYKISPLELFYVNSALYAAGSNGSNGMIVRFNVLSSSSIEVNSYWVSPNTGNAFGGIWVNSTNSFVSTANGMVYSFSNTAISGGPLHSFTFTNEAGHEHWGKTLVGSGNTLYWADWGAGFVSINISNPSSLTSNTILTNSIFKSQFPDAEGTNVYDIAIQPNTNKIFLANGWSGLVRLDMANPGVVEDYVDYPEYQNYCLALYKNFAIIGNISGGISGTEKGIKIIKIQ